MRIGSIVMLPRDSDLFLLKGVSACDGSKGRVRLQRWSNGAPRSALLSDIIELSPEEAREKLANKLSGKNRLFALMQGEEIFYGLGLLEEIQLFVYNAARDKNFSPTGRDFILELLILLAWAQTYGERYITKFYVYKKVCVYCGMVGLDSPTQTLVKRRLWKLSAAARCVSNDSQGTTLVEGEN